MAQGKRKSSLAVLLRTLRLHGVAEYKQTRYENGQPAEAIALLLAPGPPIEPSAMADASDDKDDDEDPAFFLEKIDKANAPARKQ